MDTLLWWDATCHTHNEHKGGLDKSKCSQKLHKVLNIGFQSWWSFAYNSTEKERKELLSIGQLVSALKR